MEAVTPLHSLPIFLRIHNPNGVKNYVVLSQDPDHLTVANVDNLNETVTLDKSLGRWVVPRDTTYQVEVIPETVLTGEPVIDINILQYLDLGILELLCSQVPYIQSICQQDRLWREKIEMIYSDFPLVPGYSSQEIYRRLVRGGIRGLWDWATRRRVHSLLRWIIQEYLSDTVDGMNMFYPEGTKKVWVPKHADPEEQADTEPISILSPGALTNALVSDVTRDGYVDLVELLGVSPTVADLNEAASQGHFDVLKYVNEKFNILPSKDGLNFAAAGGYLDILKWLRSKGVLPDQLTGASAAGGGHVNILEWLVQIGAPLDHSAADAAARKGRIETLRWLHSIGISSDMTSISNPIATGRLDVIQELDREGVLQDFSKNGLFEFYIGWAIGDGHTEAVKWLMDRFNLELTHRMVEEALGRNFEVSQPYAQSILKLTVDEANNAAANGWDRILSWLRVRGVNPDEKGVEYAVQNRRNVMLSTMAANRIPVPKDISLNPAFLAVVSDAARKGGIRVLQWLATGGPYYSQWTMDVASSRNRKVKEFLAQMKPLAPPQKGRWVYFSVEDKVFIYVPVGVKATNHVIIIDVDLVMGERMDVLRRVVPNLIAKGYTVILASSFHPSNEEEKREYYKNVSVFANSLDTLALFLISTVKDQVGVLGQVMWDQILVSFPNLDVSNSFFSGNNTSDEDFAVNVGMQTIPSSNLFL